jgi:hypothetical protein
MVSVGPAADRQDGNSGSVLQNPRKPKSSASYFIERSAKLFEEGASRRQIGKAPTIKELPVSPNGASKSRRDASRLVKTDDLTVQSDIQSIRGDRDLNNKGVFPLVCKRLTSDRHENPPNVPFRRGWNIGFYALLTVNVATGRAMRCEDIIGRGYGLQRHRHSSSAIPNGGCNYFRHIHVTDLRWPMFARDRSRASQN